MLLRNENIAPFPFSASPLPPPPLAPHRIRLHHARLLTAPECNHTLTSPLSSCSPAGDTPLLHTDGLCVVLPSSIFNVFPWAGRTGAMRLHSASAVASMDITHRSTRGVLKHGLLCCPPYFNAQSTEHLLHTCRRTHTHRSISAWVMIPILPAAGGWGGLSLLSLWPGENKRTGEDKKSGFAFLPSHRLVGELSHPIELLLHLVFLSALTPTGGNIPHYFSQYTTVRAPQRRSAKSNLPCLPSLIASGRRRSFFPAVTYFHLVYSNS